MILSTYMLIIPELKISWASVSNIHLPAGYHLNIPSTSLSNSVMSQTKLTPWLFLPKSISAFKFHLQFTGTTFHLASLSRPTGYQLPLQSDHTSWPCPVSPPLDLCWSLMIGFLVDVCSHWNLLSIPGCSSMLWRENPLNRASVSQYIVGHRGE